MLTCVEAVLGSVVVYKLKPLILIPSKVESNVAATKLLVEPVLLVVKVASLAETLLLAERRKRNVQKLGGHAFHRWTFFLFSDHKTKTIHQRYKQHELTPKRSNYRKLSSCLRKVRRTTKITKQKTLRIASSHAAGFRCG